MVFQTVLIFHIISGAIGLMAGIIAVVSEKGNAKHKVTGKVFYTSSLLAGVSSLILSVIHLNLFLFMVGFFTFYLVWTGNRYLLLKTTSRKQQTELIYWILTFLMLLVGVWLTVLGIFNLFNSNLFGLVYLTFGYIGLLFVRKDVRNFKGEKGARNNWLIEHFQRMTGGFIASLTAFLVVNAKYLPEFIPSISYWLMPTLILTPLIIRWTRKYKLA